MMTLLLITFTAAQSTVCRAVKGSLQTMTQSALWEIILVRFYRG
jgi:hypothetical protein